MANKKTKRARKFSATGGVKGRLEKGTITNKGKLKRKRRKDGTNGQHKKPHDDVDRNEQLEREKQRKRDESDFSGESNLAGMDIESFFEKFADKEEQNKAEESDDDVSEEEPSSDEEGSDNEHDSDDKSSDASESDDDIDAAEERMNLELGKLQSSDPEFHKFLSENEKSLLEFGDMEEAEEDVDKDEEEEEGKEEEEEPVDQESQKKETPRDRFKNVDEKVLKSFEQGAFKAHGIKSLKKLVSAYKSACHLSDADDESSKKKSYHIDSSDVFDKLMVMSLSRCHEEFRYHLLDRGSGDRGEEDDNDSDPASTRYSPKLLAKSGHWIDVKPILESFFKSTLHLLSEAKEPDLLTFVLKALADYIPFLTPFPRIAQGFLKSFTSLWSAPLDSSENYQVVRLNAFLRIRQLALTQPFPFIEDCLKKTYLAYANRAKFGTSASVTSLLPTLTFMGNCIVELYSLDYHSSYQHAFVYIRQLALHLRSAMLKKTPESLQAVYCWQYMHCLKLWVAVLTATCKEDLDEDAVGRGDEVQLMRSLIFPMTEIIFGVVRLVPTTRHLPLRLQCVRFLQQLAAAAELYVPTTSILLDVFDLKEIGMTPKKIKGRGEARGLQLPLILKLPKDSPLRSSEQLEACVSEVILLLNREVDLYRYSAGFPEFSIRICQRLRKFSKATKNGRWRAYAKGCIELCERYSAEVVSGRAALREAPKDTKRLEILKSTGTPSMGERYEAAISKEKRLEAASRPVTTKAIQSEDEFDDDEEEERSEEPIAKKRKIEKKKPKGGRKMVVDQADLANTQALKQEDEVADLDWSDDESS